MLSSRGWMACVFSNLTNKYMLIFNSQTNQIDSIITFIKDFVQNQLMKNQSLTSSESSLLKYKKFVRNNLSKGSKSHSNRSPSTQYSKFYIKNINPEPTQTYNHLILQNQKNTNKSRWSPPLRDPTPSRTSFQKQITLTQQQLRLDRAQEIQKLKGQISKYKKYSSSQKKELQQKGKQITKLKQAVSNFEGKIQLSQQTIKELNKKVTELEKCIFQKNNMIECLEKEQSAIKRVKCTAFQTRIRELEVEREELCEKVDELQKINTQASIFSINSSDNELLDCLKKTEQQLYCCYQQKEKLAIELNCQKVKFYREMVAYKNKKDLEYDELKNKFNEFIKKYKLAMKQMASRKIKTLATSAKLLRKCSIESLSLSVDDEQ